MGWSGLCAAVLVGLGALVRSVVFRAAEVSLVSSLFWGLVAAMVSLFAWHLARPIDGWASATLTLVSLEGWRRHGRALGTSARAQLTRTPFAVATFIGFWLVLPRLGMQPLTCVDAGLYFVAAIEWHSLLPYIPGLQATQPYATLNSGGFLLMSAAGVGPFAHQGYLVFNGLLAWWGLPVAVGAIEGLWRTGKQSLLAIAFAAAPGVDALVSDQMACPSGHRRLLVGRDDDLHGGARALARSGGLPAVGAALQVEPRPVRALALRAARLATPRLDGGRAAAEAHWLVRARSAAVGARQRHHQRLPAVPLAALRPASRLDAARSEPVHLGAAFRPSRATTGSLAMAAHGSASSGCC